MSNRHFVSMNIAVIGLTEMARTYALAFAGAGHKVFMAGRESEKEQVCREVVDIDGIYACSIEEAAEISDIVIIATPPKDVREVAYWLGDVRRKVIIDATSNVFAQGDDQLRTVCAIRSITGSQHIVKVFHTKGYERLITPLFSGAQVDLILVGDCRKTKEATKILLRDLGITHHYDLGTNEHIPLFTAMTTCWRELALKGDMLISKKEAVKH